VSWKTQDTKLTFDFVVPASVKGTLDLTAVSSPRNLVLNGKPITVKPQQSYANIPLTSGHYAGTLDYVPAVRHTAIEKA
jgi:hypothetical protein